MLDIDENQEKQYTLLDSLRRADYLFWEETVAEKSKVTRITAKDESPKKAKTPSVKKSAPKKAAVSAKESTPKTKRESKGFFAGIKAYFVGAWVELKQVRWPDRKATWGLTVAVILFSAFFIGLILLLDMLFGQLFEIIIG